MTKWARLEGNYVAEVINIDPTGRFHESLKWEKIPDYVNVHYTFAEDENGDKVWIEPMTYEVMQYETNANDAVMPTSTEETPAS